MPAVEFEHDPLRLTDKTVAAVRTSLERTSDYGALAAHCTGLVIAEHMPIPIQGEELTAVADRLAGQIGNLLVAPGIIKGYVIKREGSI